MGSKTRSTPRKRSSNEVPHKERFGNAVPPPNRFKKKAVSAQSRKNAAFHMREMGTR